MAESTTASSDRVETLARGEALGRYIVIEQLGAGAMGVVHAAYDPELDRKVALKILRRPEGDADESRRQARFVREAKSIAKLTHPNVVGIFDVGIDDGRTFLAMEYVAGGTLREWMTARPRSWREVVKMFVEVGQGLAAAHAVGLVHRDFKPDNVLLDRAGTPKVADFGLARLSGSAEEASGEVISTDDAAAPAALTRTGALAGTPAYMAPEQFRGKSTDGRTDQFAFCVALHEALYGRRPFDEESVFELADSVIRERVQAPPKNVSLPGWIRHSLLRGLRADPAQRYPKIEDLLAALQADPVARVRKIVLAIAVTTVVVGTFGGLYRRSEQRRIEFEGRVTSKVNEGRQALAEAAALKQRMNEARGRAFAAFDGARREEGETIWTGARASASKLDSSLKRAQTALESAVSLDQSNEPAREALGEALFERALLAELEFRKADLGHLLEQIERADVGGRLMGRWTRPASIDVVTTPGARIVLERFEPARADGNRLVAVPVGEPVVGPSAGSSLPPGSYRITATHDGFATTRYPFTVKRGEAARIDLRMMAASEVPPDFVYVPAGRFLHGDADEDWRLGFLNAAPIHERATSAFLIKAHETTFAEWIEFLQDLPRSARTQRTPSGIWVQGNLVLSQAADRRWSIELNVSGPRIKAREDSPLVYLTRRVRASQDWRRMPVLGISAGDMKAYLEWLSRTGRVPGARFCSEIEWERAARGADGRAYPGSLTTVTGDDANIDVTYGRVLGSYGPDEVGSHPQSVSPFGIDDLAGNAWEIVESRDDTGGYLIRGGSYYHAFTSARITNREGIDSATRSYVVGLRVCAATK